MMKELDIRGIALWNATATQVKPIMLDILTGVAEGSLRPLVGREMRLSEAAAAHVAVLEPGVGGKIVSIPLCASACSEEVGNEVSTDILLIGR